MSAWDTLRRFASRFRHIHPAPAELLEIFFFAFHVHAGDVPAELLDACQPGETVSSAQAEAHPLLVLHVVLFLDPKQRLHERDLR